MKKLIAITALAIASVNAQAFDVVAIGTSAINCRNVWDRERIFSVQLEKELRARGYDVNVINAGIDGDTPQWIERRLKDTITPDTKLVIVEPGPNDRNRESALHYIGNMFDYLNSINMPTIYTSNRIVEETEQEGTETARKYGVTYYGHWKREVPTTGEFFLFDTRNGHGHMSGAGCTMWAQKMAPLVVKVLVDNKIQ